MELEDFWQENKRFLWGLAGGVSLFVIGLYAVDAAFGRELRTERARLARLEKELAEPRFGPDEREEARAENEALRSALAQLSEATAFRARPEFEPDGTPAVNRYHRTVALVRERVLRAAGRANLYVDRDLGLPELSPAREEDVVRYLEGLDAVERAVDIALSVRVARLDEIAIRLDPGLASRAGTGPTERTKIELRLAGDAAALAAFLAATQRSELQPSIVEEAEIVPARGSVRGAGGGGEAKLVLELSLLRIAREAAPAGGDA